MKHVIASYPTKRSNQAVILGVLAAGYIVILLVAQLFKFDELPTLLRYFWNGTNEGSMLILASVIVLLELLSLPALLGMMLSPLMRLCSMIAGMLVVGYWFAASFYAVSSSLVRDAGMLGGIASEITGMLLPVMSVLLVALISAYWASTYSVLPTSSAKKSKSTPR